MVCAYCGGPTEVVNTREQKRSNQVWRRRRCQNCKAIFTTHETAHLPKMFLVHTEGAEEAFEPSILFNELVTCLRHRKKASEDAKELTDAITQKVINTAKNGSILPQDISRETAKVLKRFDKQAYWRFYAEHTSLQ